jgi:hypothetical protein
MKWLFSIVALALLAAAPVAHAQNLDAVAAADKAFKDALQKTPLSLPVALFVKDKASGYGMYEARESNRFKVGEPLKFYLEPLGYKYKRSGGLVTFGVSMDLRITQNGQVLFAKDNFLDVNFDSHHDNAEVMLNGSLDLTGAAPGDYKVELDVRDHGSSDIAHASLPFTIAE